MPRSSRVSVSWTHEDVDLLVSCRVTPGTPDPGAFTSKGERTTWSPADEDGSVEVEKVIEVGTGFEHPELEDVIAADKAFQEKAHAEAWDRDISAREGFEEARDEERRIERRGGRGR